MSLIYLVHNLMNNRCYIGQTRYKLNKRISGHLTKTKAGSKLPFHEALRKYGRESFDWIVLEECQEYELDDAEAFWISYYRYIGLSLYNLKPGGNSISGYKMPEDVKEKMRNRIRSPLSEETKRKLSIIHKGRTMSEKQKEQQRIRMTGRKASDKTKLLLSSKLKGRKFTDRHRNNISKGLIGKRAKSYNCILVNPEGKEYFLEKGARQFANLHGLRIDGLYDLLNNKLKTHRGWRKKIMNVPEEDFEAWEAAQEAILADIDELDVQVAASVLLDGVIITTIEEFYDDRS